MIIKATAGSSAYSNAELGIRRGNERLTKAAAEVAAATTSGERYKLPTQALLEARAAARDIAASVKALEASNRAIGSFIDTLV
ncbi:MAG: hypothetical protein AAFX58_07035 [Pseudomonadota bacterium]